MSLYVVHLKLYFSQRVYVLFHMTVYINIHLLEKTGTHLSCLRAGSSLDKFQVHCIYINVIFFFYLSYILSIKTLKQNSFFFLISERIRGSERISSTLCVLNLCYDPQ